MTSNRRVSLLLALGVLLGFQLAHAQDKQIEALNDAKPFRTVIGDRPWDPAFTVGPKVIYGTDDRHDLYQETDPLRLQLAQSTCGLMSPSRLTNDGNGTFTIATAAYDVGGLPACAGEPFADQPTAAFCTGFLVGTDLIATAGHCFDANDLSWVRFVFGFVMQDATTPVTVVNADQVYYGVELVGHALSGGLDYSVVRVDRAVTAPGALPLQIRREGIIPVGTPVGVIGHPAGLPLKIAFGAQTQVYESGAAGYFVANLDTYGGNSGSPVFDAATGIVEGILVRGAPDYDIVGSCFVSNELPDADAAEEVSKTTTFMQFIPEIVTSAGYLQLNQLKYGCADVMEVAVVDADLAGAALVAITTTNGDSEPLTLTETGTGTGRFEGAIALNTSVVVTGNGALNVAAGATITVTYNDADNGSGPAVVEKTAVVDCAAPVISNVTIEQVVSTAAIVSFATDEPAAPELDAGLSCGDYSVTAASASFGTSHSLELTGLTPLTTYYFEVRASDTAGNTGVADNGGTCFSFTTPEHVDYLTELFTTGTYDLANTTLLFSPNGSASYYGMCPQASFVFPTDPTGGTALLLGDDGAVQVSLTGGAQVYLYGQAYSSFFVGSNGYITFGIGDSEWSESPGTHFALPRISALFDDLNPGNGGLVSWKQLDDRVAVTVQNVPEYSTTNSNNFQVELFFDGAITITHLEVDATSGLVGLSEGMGVPLDFVATDLSAPASCLDLDGDGLEYDDEIFYGTDPNDPDTDHDGLNDYDEIFVYGTDPLLRDTDGDGAADGAEIALGSDPLDSASDVPLSPWTAAALIFLLATIAVWHSQCGRRSYSHCFHGKPRNRNSRRA